MALREYQNDIEVNKLYLIRLNSPSGLGEIIKPRITSIGGLVTVYGSEKEPSGLTLSNIADKMAVAGDDVDIDSWESLPNYICIVQKSGASTELVLSGINIEETIETIS